MSQDNPGRLRTPPFCHVERRDPDGKKHYVVHTESPRFVVEMEAGKGDGGSGGEGRGVIRRVCLPNSWAGDYHVSGRRLGDAVAFFDATAQFRGDPC